MGEEGVEVGFEGRYWVGTILWGKVRQGGVELSEFLKVGRVWVIGRRVLLRRMSQWQPAG